MGPLYLDKVLMDLVVQVTRYPREDWGSGAGQCAWAGVGPWGADLVCCRGRRVVHRAPEIAGGAVC